jgi:haloacetate dehalogenase
MFPGFTRTRVKTREVTIHAVHGGHGPAVLLLHGWPETHVAWHKIAPLLAKDFTVVAPDLRGYGDSERPDSDPQHVTYSKRKMAEDQVEVMRALGFQRFHVVGHDRGGRVAHRMALDHRDRVTKLVVVDIVPTLSVFRAPAERVKDHYWHWFFLAAPGLPEILLDRKAGVIVAALEQLAQGPETFTAAALGEYLRCLDQPNAVHVSCEDYRASASVDLHDDTADAERRRTIACPMLSLVATEGNVIPAFDGRTEWQEWATSVERRVVPGRHYLAEDNPTETHAAIRGFLQS